MESSETPNVEGTGVEEPVPDQVHELGAVVRQYQLAHGRFEDYTVNGRGGKRFVTCECEACQRATVLIGVPDYAG